MPLRWAQMPWYMYIQSFIKIVPGIQNLIVQGDSHTHTDSIMISSWWNERFWQGKPKYSEKTCPDATLATTNPTCQTRAWTRAAAVGSRWLTASAMAWPFVCYSYSNHPNVSITCTYGLWVSNKSNHQSKPHLQVSETHDKIQNTLSWRLYSVFVFR
jgi:hypothetical protein